MKNIFKLAKKREGREVFSNCYIQSCKKEFKPNRGSKDRGWGLFCSKSCATKWRNRDKSLADIRDYDLKKIGI